MKKWAISVTFLSLIVAIVAFYNLLNTNNNLKLTEATTVTNVMGLIEGELTLKEIMKNTDQVVIGKVTGQTTLNEDREVFEVSVEKLVLGEVANEVLVYIQDDLLIVGEKYLFFLKPYQSTLYNKDFYTQHPDLIINIDENNRLNRLVNSFEDEYIPPFEKDVYNNLDSFVGFLKEHYKGKKSPEMNAKDFTNYKDLYKNADYVIEVHVTNVDDVRGVSIVKYELIEKYKGKDKDFNLMLPTKEISENENYLLFLTSEDDTYRLATREGSIVKVGTDEYDEAINVIK